MSQFIPLDEAIQMTTRYRDNKEKVLKEEFANKNINAISETFERSGFDSLLGKEGCENIRVYYGMDEQLRIHAIFVAVNANGEDILSSGGQSAVPTTTVGAATATSLTSDDTLENGIRCPDMC